MHILIVEDNPVISWNIAEFLEMHDYTVTCVADGAQAFDRIRASHDRDTSTQYDLIILDRMLPGLDGLSIARLMKQKKITTPFLFLTAKDKLTDKLEWLEIGADDYLIKPFDLDELLFRVRNILSRTRGSSDATESDHVFHFWDLVINLQAHTVERAGNMIALSPKEFDILAYLLRNKGRVISKDEIYEHVWLEYGQDFSAFENTLTVHLSYIRKKLDSDIIRTVKLHGYIID